MIKRCLVVLIVFCLHGFSQRAYADAGDTFDEAQVFPPGVTSKTGELLFDSEESAPDLLFGAFDEFGLEIAVDDNSSFRGDGFAPALYGVPVNPDGEIDLKITGYTDTDSSGDDFEFGAFQVDLTIFDSGGEPFDGFLIDGFIEPDFLEGLFESDPLWDGGTFDAVVNNTIPNDLDFYRFTGLTPGANFSAETSPGFFGNSFVDTLIGWFDESGDPIGIDDDSGVDLYSKLTGVVPSSGEIVIAVTGFGDDFFDGGHGESGEYDLIISVEGDYDFDGDIDTDDYTAWVNDFGVVGDFFGADGNADGVIDAADYTIWRDAFEATSQPLASLPEPTGCVLLALVALRQVLKRHGRLV